MSSFAFSCGSHITLLLLLSMTVSTASAENEFGRSSQNQTATAHDNATNNSAENKTSAASPTNWEPNLLSQASKRINLENQQARGLARTYQVISAVIILLAIALAAALFVSRQRLRKINQQLTHQIETNRQSQQRQEKLAKRVAQADRMESLGALAGGVAHDFNNLLVGVVNNAQLTMKAPQNYQQYVPGILDAAKTASELAQQMLAYAGRQKMSKQALEINEVIHPLVSMIAKNAKEHSIQFHPSDAPAWAMVDNTQVGQMLLNLVSNATAASNGPVTIDISISFETVINPFTDPRLVDPSNNFGDFVSIEVRDDGHGIADEEIEKIFDPFHSSAAATGRGLGLAVVYGLVKQHRGLIRVTSELQKGTCFQILLPRTSAPKPKANQETDIDISLTTVASGFVVLVDDEELIRESSRLFLEFIGWSVKAFSSGKELLEFMRDGSNPMPDCILIDIVMPEMTGHEVVERLNDLGNTTPILIMSGYSTPDMKTYLELPNVKALMAKPFELEVLKAAVEKATGKQPASSSETNSDSS